MAEQPVARTNALDDEPTPRTDVESSAPRITELDGIDRPDDVVLRTIAKGATDHLPIGKVEVIELLFVQEVGEYDPPPLFLHVLTQGTEVLVKWEDGVGIGLPDGPERIRARSNEAVIVLPSNDRITIHSDIKGGVVEIETIEVSEGLRPSGTGLQPSGLRHYPQWEDQQEECLQASPCRY